MRRTRHAAQSAEATPPRPPASPAHIVRPGASAASTAPAATASGKAPAATFTFVNAPATGGEAGPQYQLLIRTTGYPAGTYTLSFKDTGDPVTHTLKFTITRA